MLRRTYDRLMLLAASPAAPVWLALVAFCEGIFFPVPPDVMLIPMVLARRGHAWRYVVICVLASICGGSVGYAVGHFLHPVGHWLLSLTGAGGDNLDRFDAWYAKWGVLLLALPIPYKLMAIASGLANFNYPLFVGASLLIRGARFSLVAALTSIYGEPIRGFIEKRLALVVSAVAIVIVVALMALRLVH
jgi:membrane protein YqaA with SNARE-associated domain